MRAILAVFLFLLVAKASAQKDSLGYMPAIDGVIRGKFEYNSSTGKTRFEVRNARFQVVGYVTKVFNYKAEIDLSDEGQIKMLDAYVKFIPLKGLSATMGQMKIPFSTDNLRSPGTINFSNRSFIAKRICRDLREIGFMLSYSFGKKLPFAVHAGIFNGAGINNPQWMSSHNFGLRMELGPFKGWGISGNYYTGKVSGVNSDLFDVGVNYRFKNLFIDAEYAQKHTIDTSGSFSSNAFFAYVLYEIGIKEGMLRHIIPAVRYDFYTTDLSRGAIEPARITAGLTFGFSKISWADIRLSYEKYLYKTLANRDDKATVEFIARF
jgi:hypothetical protein